MLKRHLPIEPIDGLNTTYSLPRDYIGASVNIFVNGVLYASEGLSDHTFGFYVNHSDKTITFFNPLENGDSLFLLYDSDGNTTGAGGFTGSGSIEIEPNKWQLCAIPVTSGEWANGGFTNLNVTSTFHNYVVTQLEEKYGTNIGNLIEVANTKTGDSQFYFNYIPNITTPDSPHNFRLIYEDYDNDAGDGKVKHEITGFWIKSKTDIPLVIDWEIIS